MIRGIDCKGAAMAQRLAVLLREFPKRATYASALQGLRDKQVIEVLVLTDSDKTDELAIDLCDMVAKLISEEPSDCLGVVLGQEALLGPSLEFRNDELRRQF